MGKPVGVYLLHNKETGEGYIGSGILKDREAAHFANLVKNKHDNYRLQRAYNRNPNFDFIGVETETREEALQVEDALIKEEWGNPFLLNIAQDASAPMYGRTQSEEARRKISESLTGRPGSNPGPEAREKIRQVHLGNSHHAGHKHSDEARRKMSEAGKRRMANPEVRKQISQSLQGKTPTEKTRAKLREAQTHITQTEAGKQKLALMNQRAAETRSRPVVVGNTTYPSIAGAARAHGISINAAHNRVNSGSGAFPDWNYLENKEKK